MFLNWGRILFSLQPVLGAHPVITVNLSHLHHNIVLHECEAISGYFVVLVGNCLAHMLDYNVLQMKN